jgi:hypothetical protein
MYILNNLKVSIKRKNLKSRKRSSSVEEKVKLRILRKDPAERRKQAVKDCFHTAVEQPVRVVCKATIPTSEEEKWHRGFASVNPTLGLLLLFVAFDRK